MTAISLLLAAMLLAQSVPQPFEWPAPPEPARIRYIRSLQPAAIRPRRSLLSRIARAIAGAGREPAMTQPYGVTVASDRRVYVADTAGGVLHVFDLEKPAYSTLHLDFDSLIGVASFGDRLFVTDSASGRVAAVDFRGRVIWSRGPKDGFERPTGIAAGPDRVYVVDTMRHRVMMLGLDGVPHESFGRRGTLPGEFNFPTNIARSADGRLFVTDAMNFRVQVFDRTGRFLQSFGQLGDGPGDFDKPKGIGVDRDGHVYVVESVRDLVNVFDTDGRVLMSFGGSGQGAGELWLPAGLALVNDVVYVVDSANRRVQMFQRLESAR